VVVTLGEQGEWRAAAGEWQAFPRMALRGAATCWSDGFDAPGVRNEYLAALLEPWAVKRMFGISASEVHNQVVDLQVLWPSEAPALYERISSASDGRTKLAALTNCLVERSSGWVADPLVQAYLNICRRTAGTLSSEGLLASTSCSKRNFRTAFRGEMGVLPKRWALLERFAARLREMHPSSWGSKDDIGEANYADQAHEIHEFVRHTGITPGAYRKLKLGGDPRVFMIARPQ
jgi:AraC-like DNA-binding protein